MTIKEFVDKYNNIEGEKLRQSFVKDTLKIKKYIPFIQKVTYAELLAKSTMLNNETGEVRVNSTSNYLFFCRTLIQCYTDLTVENPAFYEEYDLLNETGALEMIMNLLPEKDVNEFKAICDMTKDDILYNRSTTQAFLGQQVEKVSMILGISLKPVLEKISQQLDNMSEEDINNMTGKIEKMMKWVK